MFPGFPVEVGGVAELHAAFREESRTRGCVPKPRNRKSGFAPAYMGHPSRGWLISFYETDRQGQKLADSDAVWAVARQPDLIHHFFELGVMA
jgi:hypothetical protein